MYVSSNRVIIDLSAIRHNLNQVRAIIGSGVSIMGIVKSDAYGHGLVEVADFLVKEGVQYLGVAHVEEAMALRESGIRVPVFLLCGFNGRDDAVSIIKNDIIPVVYDIERARILNEECLREGKGTDICIKMDTGMGRLGVMMEDVPWFFKKISSFGSLRLRGIMSHLSSADEDDRSFTSEQINRFKKIVDELRREGFKLDMNTLSNSAGIMKYREADFDIVRPGIMLYGGLPDPDFIPPVELRPAMKLAGRVLQIKGLPPGHPVGYGRSYTTKDKERIAVISCGYGDGIPRSLSNRGQVLIRGMRYHLVGRVSMNITVARIGEGSDIKVGDEAVFLGAQGDDMITGDEMARWANTISYEIFCSIGSGKSREYVI